MVSVTGTTVTRNHQVRPAPGPAAASTVTVTVPARALRLTARSRRGRPVTDGHMIACRPPRRRPCWVAAAAAAGRDGHRDVQVLVVVTTTIE